MLTIKNIEQLKLDTIQIGNTNDYTDWDIYEVETKRGYYTIKLKCIRCSPAGPILGTIQHVTLQRIPTQTAYNRRNRYKLHCFGRRTKYIGYDDMKGHGAFSQTLLKLLS